MSEAPTCNCSKCGKEFKDKRGARIHEAKCTGTAGNICDACHSEFSNAYGLQRHRLVCPVLSRQKQEEEIDRKIELISGYRLGERGFHSYHNFGRALDFRAAGVDNKRVYDFILTLPKCGTGYYPNSVFVHLDVRDKKTTWTDYSGVGEPSVYKKPKE